MRYRAALACVATLAATATLVLAPASDALAASGGGCGSSGGTGFGTVTACISYNGTIGVWDVIADSYIRGTIPANCVEVTDIYRNGVLVATSNNVSCRAGQNAAVAYGSWDNQGNKYYSTTCVYVSGVRRACVSSKSLTV